MHELLDQALTCEMNLEWPEALKLLQQAHQLDPSRVSLLAAMAQLMERLGRHQEAFTLLEQSLKAQPHALPARLGLAELLRRHGDRGGARQAYAAVLEHCPEHLGAKLALGALGGAAPSHRLLLVLGMHRSGTSAVARALCKLGCRAPATMPPADPNNPTGYWEPKGIIQLHTTMLEREQSSWDDPLLGEHFSDADRLACFTPHLEAALQAEFPVQSESDVWCLIKDPRQCRLQPVWNHLIARLGHPCVVVVVNRHPLAVVASLQKREKIPANRALLLWIQHQLDAERHTRLYPRQIVTYETFLEKPVKVLDGIAALLGASQLKPMNQIQDLVRPSLNHSAGKPVTPDGEVDGNLIQLALEVYNTLRRSTSMHQQQRLDQLHGELERHLRMLRSQLTKMTNLQLFWKLEGEAEFSERNSIRSSINVNRGSTSHTFELPEHREPIQALRFDPGENPSLVRIHRLSVHNSNGDLLWQWLAAEARQAIEQTAPFQPANRETRLLAPNNMETDGLGVLCEGHDPALLVNLPVSVIAQISSRSSLTVEGSWESLSSGVSQLLGARQS